MLASCCAVGVDGELLSSKITFVFCVGFSSSYPIFCTAETKFCDTRSTVSISDVSIHVRFSSPRYASFNDSMMMKAV